MGAAPPDLEIYELALLLHKTPDEIRQMPIDDRNNLQMVSTAKNLAEAQLLKREAAKAKR